RGRVMALYMTIVMGGTPLGSPVIGWIGETYGARWCLIVGGVMVIVGVGLAFVVFLRTSHQTIIEALRGTAVIAPVEEQLQQTA
ncbi:MAG: MFS transporter, partial [Nocardioides sp.]|nr:MFS transporter [Nocardioides sp.]